MQVCHFSILKGIVKLWVIMAGFKLQSSYSPTGDQPQAIKELVAGLEKVGVSMDESAKTILNLEKFSKMIIKNWLKLYEKVN